MKILLVSCTTLAASTAFAQKAAPSEFDIAGFRLSMSESAVRKLAEREFGKHEWSSEPMEEVRIQGRLVRNGYDLKFPYSSPNGFGYKVTGSGKIIEIRYSSNVQSDATLESIVEPAYKKYGKPFQVIGGNLHAASWALDARGNRIDNHEIGRRECIEFNMESAQAPDCSLIVTFGAKKVNAGRVEITRKLTSPLAEWKAYQAVKGEGKTSIRY